MTRWGWRVPLLLGCLIIPLLFVLRGSLQETGEFLARKVRPQHGRNSALAGGQLARSWSSGPC